MKRRALLGGLLATFGGNPPQRPDQVTDPPPMVVAPGGASGVFRGRLVIVSGGAPPGSGIFIYNSSGQLVGSWTGRAGTDPVNGGPVPAGLLVQNGAGSNQVTVTGSGITINKLSGALAPPLISLSDATAATTDGTTIHSSGTITPEVDGVIPGNTAGVADSWNAVSFANGWANSGTGPGMQYRAIASPPLSVELIGDMAAGTLTSPTTIFTLPAVYRPASVQSVLPIASGGGAGLVAGTSRIVVNTNGTVTATGMAGFTGGGRIFIHTIVSLDAV